MDDEVSLIQRKHKFTGRAQSKIPITSPNFNLNLGIQQWFPFPKWCAWSPPDWVSNTRDVKEAHLHWLPLSFWSRCAWGPLWYSTVELLSLILLSENTMLITNHTLTRCAMSNAKNGMLPKLLFSNTRYQSFHGTQISFWINNYILLLLVYYPFDGSLTKL